MLPLQDHSVRHCTRERCRAKGGVPLAPPPNNDLLFNTNFDDGVPFVQAGSGSHVRGWQADPIIATTGVGVSRYSEPSKNSRRRRFLRALNFTPVFQTGNEPRFETVRVSQLLDSPRSRANLPIGLGPGMAVIVEKTSLGVMRIENGKSSCAAFLSLRRVDLVFGGRLDK